MGALPMDAGPDRLRFDVTTGRLLNGVHRLLTPHRHRHGHRTATAGVPRRPWHGRHPTLTVGILPSPPGGLRTHGDRGDVILADRADGPLPRASGLRPQEDH